MKLGIIGWPLGYSLSPLMHNAALKAAGLQGEYKEYKVKPEELERWLAEEAPELDGFNVTMPHKTAVWEHINKHGKFGPPFPELVRDIGAVNTVRVEEGRFFGYNTDGPGFMAPFGRSGSFKRKEVLLLGAGGAARAIAVYLASAEQVGSLSIWNRNPERAEELAARVNGLRLSCKAAVVKDIVKAPVERMALVINATPTGMNKHEESPLECGRLGPGQVVYDIVYDPRETRLIAGARKQGCRVIRGDEMLAGQGAVAFEIWTNIPSAKVLPVMEKALDEHFTGRG
ncbi:MAG: shikimate dehydrogenase [Candidatus Omnitrophota bacterium]|nr:shikimate dehydrogenase [Candidatus Omnitrophota bacterium]